MTECTLPSIFKREPREGGYCFVTTPDFPGFSMMLEPGEDDTQLNAVFLVFLAVELQAAKLRAHGEEVDHG